MVRFLIDEAIIINILSMKKIYLLPLLIAFLSTNLLIAQKPKVKIKNGYALVDDNACLKFSSNINGTTFSDLEGNELIFLSYKTKTESNPAYTKIIFLKEKKMVTNHSAFLSRKTLIMELISNKVLVDCKMNPDALDIFIMKYHEEIPVYTNVNIKVESE